MRETVSFEEKATHPRLRVNWLSLITFWYTIKTFVAAMKRPIVEADVSDPLPSHRSNLLGHKIAKGWTDELDMARRMQRKPKLINALRRCFFGRKLVSLGVVIGVVELIRLVMPIFVSLTVKYFSQLRNATDTVEPLDAVLRMSDNWSLKEPITRTQLYLYGCGIVVFNLIPVMVFHPVLFEFSQIGMCMRIACCSLIYRKALRLDAKVIDGKTASTNINLLLQNLNKFDSFPLFLHYLWIGPSQIIIITCIFYSGLGKIALFSMFAFVLIIPINLILAMLLAKLRHRSCVKSEQRLRQMEEIISGITSIKMYNWEDLFLDHVGRTRKTEMSLIRYQNYTRGFFAAVLMFVTRGGVFVEILMRFLQSSDVSAEMIFFILAYFHILRQTMTIYFPTAVTHVFQANMAVEAVDHFLSLEETTCGDAEPLHPHENVPRSVLRSRAHLDPRVHPDSRLVLENVTYAYGGRVAIDNVSFVAVPHTLTVIVGPMGSGKSTLLKLILNECRPLAGTVRTIGLVSFASENAWLFFASIRQNILFGLPFNITRYRNVIDVCALGRDLSKMRKGDRTVIAEEGVSLSSGQKARIHLARAIYKEADIYLLDDPFVHLDARIASYVYENCVCEFLREKIVLLTTHIVEYVDDADQVIVLDDGRIQTIGTPDEVRERIADMSTTNMATLNDYITQQFPLRGNRSRIALPTTDKNFVPIVEGRRGGEELVPRNISKWVYWVYLRFFGNCFVLFALALLFLLAQGLGSSCDYFLIMCIRLQYNSKVSVHTIDNKPMDRSTCLQIYTALIVTMVAATLTRSLYFFERCKVASVKFHDAMMKSVMHTDLQFFHRNQSEQILNRFSKDLATIDEMLPRAILESAQFFLNLTGVMIILTIVSPFMLAPTVLCCCSIYAIRRVYVNANGTMALLEGRLKTPLYSHLHATLLGLTTIRTHGGEPLLVAEFDKYQDKHTGAWFLLNMTDRAFAYWVDLIGILLIASVIVTFIVQSHFVPLRSEVVGLAITQCLGLFGMFQHGIGQSVTLSNNIVSVDNAMQYVTLTDEQEQQVKEDPPQEWPQHGTIEYRDVSVRYDADTEPVLYNVSFKVEAHEKIGIVGRTGAGKTSLILALFQLIKVHGQIFIDDIDVGTLNYAKFRNKISIIPQEPILFYGTLRHNIDPFEQYTDMEIYKALLLMEHKTALSKGIGCLDDAINEGGGNLSNGEKQLLCLTRAILNRNRLIVLDAATSYMDPVAEIAVQSILEEKFANCTIVTIAHRLNVIVSYDKVLLIDGGQVLEYDHPYALIQRKGGGLFARMIEDSGNAVHLKRIAESNYKRKGLQTEHGSDAPSTSSS